MRVQTKMNINERRKYLKIMQERYMPSDRAGRTELLDEMGRTVGLHRKSLVRLMHSDLDRKPRRKQRGRSYGPQVDDAIRVIWETLDFLCAERLTPALPWMAQLLDDHGELYVPPEVLQQLDRISIATVGRILKRISQDTPRLSRKRRKSGNSVTAGIPTRRIPRDEQQPGHLETDLVHQCGPSASGEYLHTLQMVDVTTGWSELVAVLGRSYRVVEDAFCRILARIPFPIIEVHPDNDSVFLNHHCKRFWKDKVPNVHLSRSRPWHSNDNRLVEEKNSSLVRKYLGHDRLDTAAQTLAVNRLYDKIWVYYNLFLPVMHLQEKIYVPREGQTSRVKRRFDVAQTPFDRLCATKAISPERREALENLRRHTNPRRLREEIYDQIDYIFSLPGAVPGTTEDVFQTLSDSNPAKKGDPALVTLSFE
jgi:hypothetical protein